jgi:hypothetical protein
MRKAVTQAARRDLQARWHQTQGRHAHRCEDPDCHADHGPGDNPHPEPATLAAGVRSVLG